MTKNKKIYAAPVMHKQVFVPNAYMRQCLAEYSLKVQCDWEGLDESPNDASNNTHSGHTTGAGCGNPDSQSITYNDGTWTFVEVSKDDLVTEFTPLYYSDIYKYTEEKTLKWYTHRTGANWGWHHYGHIIIENDGQKKFS